MSSAADQNPGTPPARLRLKKLPRAIRMAVTATVVLTSVILAVWAFESYEYSPWTRDGRINAYVVDTAAEVSGLVTDVFVQDNQFVRKGEVLYKIDVRDYEAAVKRTRAAVDSAQAPLQRIDVEQSLGWVLMLTVAGIDDRGTAPFGDEL